jgi:alkylation response protein AidB-like acyl-CoA dehydrogenase
MELRRELRAWLGAHVTPDVVDAGRRPVADESLETLRAWNRQLADARWAAPAWPIEHGGRAAGLDEQVAYYEEMDAAQAPGPINAIGVANIAPAIMAFGTDEQQARFLRPMLRGDEIWSQGMSEPDSGSDLASLRTRAEPDGAGFVVNGQKTWNSLGHLADWCQLYVRTDSAAPKHRGISCLLVDLRSPGIEVRPLRTMTGEVSFSELFFSDVRVPAAALLGPLHGGWDVAMTTLSHERAGVARFHLVLRSKLDALLAEPAARGALRDRRHRQRVARLWSQIACMRWTTERSLAQLRLGAAGGTAGSLAKLAWSRADQALAELATNLLGLGALSGDWAYNLASSRSTSIAGGTSEINRNIVAEQGLGLPRG